MIGFRESSARRSGARADGRARFDIPGIGPVAVAAATVLALACSVVAPVAVAQEAVPSEALLERVAGEDRFATAVAISVRTHDAAEVAVVAGGAAVADALAAAPLAAHLEAPLLLVADDGVPDVVGDELVRLGVSEVVLLGGDAAVSRSVEEQLAAIAPVRRLRGEDRFATAASVAVAASSSSPVAYLASGRSFVDALGVGSLAAHRRAPLLLTEPGALPDATRDALLDLDVETVTIVGGEAVVSTAVEQDLRRLGLDVARIAGADRWATSLALLDAQIDAGLDPERVWLATGRQTVDALAAGPAAAAAGDPMLLVDGQDLRRPPAIARRLRALAQYGTQELVLVGGEGAISREVAGMLDMIRFAEELPRDGGFALFPHNLLVAHYGHHSTPRLGVLGERPPEQATIQLEEQAAEWVSPGRRTLPVVHLIVDIATREAGDDGDHSKPSTPEQIQPWLDAARDRGQYLLLDLQTGRTDFLTAAKRYEEFLRQPDVGLALDPEWRLDPGERPGATVGEVDAAEVMTVADWLGTLVDEEHLPQKLLVVHQFQNRMIERPALLASSVQVEINIHMDGHGTIGGKIATYRNVIAQPGDFTAGFKLFFDEDPVLMRPDQVLSLDPSVDFVSYQ